MHVCACVPCCHIDVQLTVPVAQLLWSSLKHPITVQAAEKQLKEVKTRASDWEQHFEKELATAQKLAALYKTAADDRMARCTELEGVMRELKEHVQVMCGM